MTYMFCVENNCIFLKPRLVSKIKVMRTVCIDVLNLSALPASSRTARFTRTDPRTALPYVYLEYDFCTYYQCLCLSCSRLKIRKDYK